LASEEMVNILKIYQNIQKIGKWLRGGEALPLIKRKKCQEIINLEHLLTKPLNKT